MCLLYRRNIHIKCAVKVIKKEKNDRMSCILSSKPNIKTCENLKIHIKLKI